MSTIFDDIYEGKFNKQFKDLKRSVKKAQIASKERTEPVTNDEITNLLSKARNNPQRAFSKEEAELINKKLEDNLKEANHLLKEIKVIKDGLYEDIQRSNNTHTLDISKSSPLKRSATNVFGGNKKEITYEDYLTLLELRKQIETDEIKDLISGIIENNV